MSIILRKRIRVLPGVYLNLSKRGVGISVGPRGLKAAAGPTEGGRVRVSGSWRNFRYTKRF